MKSSLYTMVLPHLELVPITLIRGLQNPSPTHNPIKNKTQMEEHHTPSAILLDGGW